MNVKYKLNRLPIFFEHLKSQKQEKVAVTMATAIL